MIRSALISLCLLLAFDLTTGLTTPEEAKDTVLLLNQHLSLKKPSPAFKKLEKTINYFKQTAYDVTEHLSESPIFVQTSTQKRLEELARLIFYVGHVFEIASHSDSQGLILLEADGDSILNKEIARLNWILKGDPEIEEGNIFSLLVHKDSARDVCFPAEELINMLYENVLNTEYMIVIAKLRILDSKPSTGDNNDALKHLFKDNEIEKFTDRITELNKFAKEALDCGKKNA